MSLPVESLRQQVQDVQVHTASAGRAPGPFGVFRPLEEGFRGLFVLLLWIVVCGFVRLWGYRVAHLEYSRYVWYIGCVGCIGV